MALTAIVKPTHDCNLRCEYCYMEPAAERGFMSDETLRNTIRQLLAFGPSDGHVGFIWHGGEPLLAGQRFYEQVVAYQAKYQRGQTITNGIQTNGTLLTEQLAAFFAEHGFSVGLSLDGPRAINDLTRHYADGTSCHADVLKAHQIARNNNIGKGVITVLTRRNASRVRELYSFFASHDINVKVNPLINAGRGRDRFSDLALTPQEYGTVMVDLFDLWFQDLDASITVSPFDSMLASLVTDHPTSCDFMGRCQSEYLSIGPTGAVYPCGRFDGIAEFRIGNINADDIATIMASPVKQRMLSRLAEKLTPCGQCGYRIYCNGGCLHNAWVACGNVMRSDPYCTGYRTVFSRLKRALEDELLQAVACGAGV